MKLSARQWQGLALLGLVLALGSAYGLEHWLTNLRNAPWEAATPHLLAWGTVLAYLFNGCLLLGLAWLVAWAQSQRWIAALYLSVGLLGLLAPAFWLAFPQNWQIPFDSGLWLLLYPSGALLPLCFTLLAVSGAAGLLVRRGPAI